MEPAESFCALASIVAGEPLLGTATGGVDAWLLVEHGGTWGSKAWQQAEIPPAVREHVDAWERATAGSRIQLVKRDETRARGALRVLVVSSRPSAPLGAEIVLPQLDALVDVDLHAAIAALRRGELPAGARALERPLVLVCTNGKRDRCCAKWGVPVFDAIAKRSDIDAWQTTHLGGHRFAATLVWLPEGLCYGRVGPTEIGPLVDAALARRIEPLDHLRGRTALLEAGQAAEVLLRREHEVLGFDDVVVDDVREEKDDDPAAPARWRVNARVRGKPRELVVVSAPLGTVAAGSCGKEPEPVRGWQLGD